MLTVHNTEAIRRIEEAIGYTFHDKRLLVQVLTRKTYLKIDPEAPDNEVLEFYGDTLMNYHVTNYFMSKYAHMLDDGLFFMRTVEQFTDMRSHYVCNRYLTDRVKALGLSRYLRAQNRDAELRRDGEKAYADIFESLVGAIYLDSYQNDNLIRAFILRQLGIEPKRLPEDIEAFDYDSLSAPIPSLSEYREIPVTEEAETEAVLPVEAVSSVEAEKSVPEVMPAAQATPVEIAPVEAEAAVETIVPEARATEVTVKETLDEPVLTPKQEALAALCRALGYELPTYGETPKNAPNARPVAACTLKYKDAKGKLVKISLNDSGKTLAEATEKAAAKMLKKLEKQAADAAPKAEMPESAPAPVAPVSEAPVEVTPVEATPVEATPVETASAEVILAVETIAEEVVATEVVVEVAPAEAAVEVAPAEETPVADAPAEVAPVAEVSAEAAPAEAAPVEESAVAEAPAEEIPVAEAKAVEEAPAVEAGKPAKKKNVPKKSAIKRQDKEELAAEGATPAEAPAEEAKPAKAKKAPAKKKAAPKEDKPAEEAAVTEAPVEEAKPAKAKKAPARKKTGSKKELAPEATDTKTE